MFKGFKGRRFLLLTHTSPRLTFDGFSTQINLYFCISKLGCCGRILESKFISNKHTMSNLCRELYSLRSEIFKNLWAGTLFKFRWHTENFWSEVGFRPGINSSIYMDGFHLISMFVTCLHVASLTWEVKPFTLSLCHFSKIDEIY